IAVSADGQSCQISGRTTYAQTLTSHTVSADNSGGRSQAVVAVRVRPPAPALSTISSQRIITGRTLRTNLIFANTGGAVSNAGCLATTPLPDGLIIGATADGNSCEISGTPLARAAAQDYIITAINDGGQSTATFTLEVLVAPPQLTRQLPRTFIPGVGVDIIFVNVGGDLSDGRCSSLLILPPGLTFTRTDDRRNCRLHGVPEGKVNWSLYPLLAQNSTRSSISTFAFEIVTGLPALSVPATLILMQGEPFTVDLNNATVEPVTACTVELPDGLAIAAIADGNGCRLSGTPVQAAAAQEYEIIVRASNVSAVAVIAVHVLPPPPDLTIAGDTDLVYTVNETDRVVTIANRGGPAEQCIAEPTLPVGLSVQADDQGNCTISGSPGRITQSQHTITAINAGGRDPIALTVDIRPPPPSFTAPSQLVLTAGQEITTTLTNTGGPVDANSCQLSADTPQSALPAGGVGVVGAQAGPLASEAGGVGVVGAQADPLALPAGVRLESTPDGLSCRLAGIPVGVLEPTNYIIVAANAGGQTSFPLTLTVLPAPPDIESAATLTAIAGLEFVFDFVNLGGDVAADDGCAVSPSLPAGLAVAISADGHSCQITGLTPLENSFGYYTLTAQNASGVYLHSFSLTVRSGTPVLAQPAPVAAVVGEAIRVVVSNVGQGTVASCAGQLPTGLNIAASTNGDACVISGAVNEVLASTLYQIHATGSGGQLATVDIAIRINPRLPSLTAPVINTAIVALEPLSLVVANTGGPLDACFYIAQTEDGAYVNRVSINGLNISIANNNLDCLITGAPTSAGALILRVGATNISGSNEARVSLTIQPHAPIIAAPSTITTIDGSTIDPITINNRGGTADTCHFIVNNPLATSEPAPTSGTASGTTEAADTTQTDETTNADEADEARIQNGDADAATVSIGGRGGSSPGASALSGGTGGAGGLGEAGGASALGGATGGATGGAEQDGDADAAAVSIGGRGGSSRGASALSGGAGGAGGLGEAGGASALGGATGGAGGAEQDGDADAATVSIGGRGGSSPSASALSGGAGGAGGLGEAGGASALGGSSGGAGGLGDSGIAVGSATEEVVLDGLMISVRAD
ncbi:MAG: hypothetical protein K8963_07580, partial [Proteobacteria bacterium]|nr:hypothetical protein [Pseudomonadota bacterium]